MREYETNGVRHLDRDGRRVVECHHILGWSFVELDGSIVEECRIVEGSSTVDH